LSGMPETISRFLDALLKIVLVLLISVCVLDPASQLLGLKEVLFVSAWALFIFNIIATGKSVYIPIGMIIYLLLFIFVIPIASIIYYTVAIGDFAQYDGYIYFKPYLFLTMAIILYGSNYDLIKPTMVITSCVSALTLFILLICVLHPAMVTMLHEDIGVRYGIFVIGSRGFDELPFPQVFFHTSALIAFPLAYYCKEVLDSKGLSRLLFALLLMLNIVGMFLGATRNNLLFSIMVPIFIIFWYSKMKKWTLTAVALLAFIMVLNNHEIIVNMLDANERSNAYKISFLNDYMDLFSDVQILLLGQGLGSYFFTEARGYVSLTELTYVEFVRRFGIIVSLIVFFMLLCPLYKLFYAKYRDIHYFFISYFVYLIMCFFNPLLMSSTGMLILSIALYHAFAGRPPSRRSVPHIVR
jgi:hypothetical protein